MRKNQTGLAHLIVILLTVIVLGVAGFAGYRVYQKSSQDKEDQKLSQQTGTSSSNKQASHTGTCNPPGALANAEGAFTAKPFELSKIKLITNGNDTNDSRFVYPWIRSGATPIYAPADGVLYKIRHKVFEEGGQKGDDYDIFFQVSCDTVYRFNHITDPRADIKAAYPAGNLASGDYANGGTDIPERVQPTKAITVKAGESLGSTTGTPLAHNFDFAVGTAKGGNGGELIAVCPFNVFTEPLKSQLLALMGPKNGSPEPGYKCDVEAKQF